MLPDTRIIHRHGGYQVQAQRHEVTWRDGSSVQLHPVQREGTHGLAFDLPFDRALQLEHGGGWLIFDLRRLAPDLAAEIPALPPRDTPGLVFHTLRLAYPCAQAFVDAARRQFKAAWLTETAMVAA